jgi:2-dehydropantoate 2-reductase
MKIGILGSGALGSLFAYQLARHTSHEVWLLARQQTFSTVTVDGAPAISVPICTNPDDPVDLLLVLVKAYATSDALIWAQGAIGSQTIGLTLQNGLGNAEAIARYIRRAHVLVGTTAQGATRLGPGQIRHGGQGPTYIAAWAPGPEPNRHVAQVAAVLNQALIPTTVVSDPQRLLWSKLAVNCGINALTALLGVANGELLTRPSARRLLVGAVLEVMQVAAAKGVSFTEDMVAVTLAVAEATGWNRSSMLQDVESGRPTEIDTINGAVVIEGEAVGIATPINQTLTELIRSLGHRT